MFALAKRILVTSALPYVHGIPHIGNAIGSVLPADAYTRFQKLEGNEVAFFCGSDDHGTSLDIYAIKAGVPPLQLATEFHEKIKSLYEAFGCEFTFYGRTHSKENTETTQEIFKKLHANGYILEQIIEQPYCRNCKRFLADRYVEGECPKCHGLGRGDQCDSCGVLLDPKDLIKPHCTICGKEDIEIRQTKHLFLDLPRLEPLLFKWFKGSEGRWLGNAAQYTQGWFDTGLKPRCISRDSTWGIPIPLPGYEGKIFYVWFDAPIGYISITKEWANSIGKPDEWKRWWLKPDDVEYVEFLGKDNIVFHSIIFPAMLIGSRQKWKLVDEIVLLEFLQLRGLKMSKSQHVGLFLDNALAIRPADYWRFALFALWPLGADTEFTLEVFRDKVNNELVDTYGNFVHRVLTFAQNNFGGKVPEGKPDAQLLDEWQRGVLKIEQHYAGCRFKEALYEMLALAQRGNAYFNAQEPWKAIKTDRAKAANAVWNAVCMVKGLAIAAWPLLPYSSERVWGFLGLPGKPVDKGWAAAAEFDLKPGAALNPPEVLFKKIDEPEMADLKARLAEKPAAAVKEGEKMVKFDDFAKLDIRIAKVLKAEDIPGSKKLVKLEVEADRKRTVVAGIKERYPAASLVGRQVVVVVNLEPRKIAGIESEGMLLAAEDMTLLAPEKETKPGSKIS